MPGKILVVGATGTVGTPLVVELLSHGEKVKGGSRSASSHLPDGVEGVRIDLSDPSTVEAALKDVDRVYVMEPSGTADTFAALAPVIEAAGRHGAKVVLQSAMGVDADDNIPLRQVELLLEKTGIPYVILRPNWFVDNFASYWADGVSKGEVRLPAGEGKTSFIDARDVAAAAAAALTSNAYDGQAFVLTGREAHNYGEALALLSESLGRKVSYHPVDVPTFIRESIAGGLPQEYAEAVAGIFHTVAEGWAADITNGVELLTGRPPRSLKSAVRDLVAKL